MDANVQEIQDALTLYGFEAEHECHFVIDLFVYRNVTSANVHEVLGLLSGRGVLLNRLFWQEINNAPETDDKWDALVIIGSGGEEVRNSIKDNYRRAVEIVRDAVGSIKQHGNQAFRK